MGATADGKKELVAVAAGHRESEQSWLALLLDCKARGMEVAPLLATGDGALGFWKALPQVWSTTRTQRCWVHKTVNVLDKLPRSQHGAAKKMLHNIYLAETRGQGGHGNRSHVCYGPVNGVPGAGVFGSPRRPSDCRGP